MRGSQGLSERLEEAQSIGQEDAAGVEERAVPEAQLVTGRRFLADRPQQAVALLEDPPIGRERVGIDGRAA